MNEQTPVNYIAEFIAAQVGGYSQPTIGMVEQARDLIAHLDAAGFRVSSKPDDDTRREAKRIIAALAAIAVTHRHWSPILGRAADMLERYVLGEVRSDG